MLALSLRELLDAAYHWLHELDTVVLRRVVRRCDHDTNPFSPQCPRSKGCNKADTGQDGVEDIATAVSFVCAYTLEGAGSTAEEGLRFCAELPISISSLLSLQAELDLPLQFHKYIQGPQAPDASVQLRRWSLT